MIIPRKYLKLIFILFIFNFSFSKGQVVKFWLVTQNTDPSPLLYNSLIDNPIMKGTLQWAIRKANDYNGPSVISFQITGASHEIILNQSLPVIKYNININGTTQTGAPVVINSSNLTGNNITILTLQSSLSRITGLTFIDSQPRSACSIFLFQTANSCFIENNRIDVYEGGINLASSYNEIYNNYINTHGVNLGGIFIGVVGGGAGGNNKIGDIIGNKGNIINGVIYIWGGTNNRISGNFFGKVPNKYTGIYLPYYVSNGQNFLYSNDSKWSPEITSLITGNGTGSISGKSSPHDYIEVFTTDGGNYSPERGVYGCYCNTVNYLGSTTADGNGNWRLNNLLLECGGGSFTATATDLRNNTSMLSWPYSVSNPNSYFSITQANCKSSYPVEFQNKSLLNIVGSLWDNNDHSTSSVSTPNAIKTDFLWDFGDNSTSTSLNASHTYSGGGAYTVKLNVATIDGCKAEYSKVVTICPDIPCCELQVPLDNTSGLSVGSFSIDDDKGAFVYKANGSFYTYNCISGNGHDKVINASSNTLDDNWSLSANTSSDPYETGEKGKWRIKSSYVYKDELNQEGEAHNYNQGRFPLTPFKWDGSANSPKWLATNIADKISANGDVLEDHDILNIKTTAKYGYNNTLKVLFARNAAARNVAFESFENTYTTAGVQYFEDNLPVSTGGTLVSRSTINKVHSGLSSIKLDENTAFTIANISLNPTIADKGLLVRIWLCSGGTPLYSHVKVTDGTSEFPMTLVAGAGEWLLYEGTLTKLAATGNIDIKVKVDAKDVFMDDVRVQPLESEMSCYVYDNSQRLLTVLDDQHFGTFYQYNAEGLLVRKLKETTEGLKTISSEQYNSRGVPK